MPKGRTPKKMHQIEKKISQLELKVDELDRVS